MSAQRCSPQIRGQERYADTPVGAYMSMLRAWRGVPQQESPATLAVHPAAVSPWTHHGDLHGSKSHTQFRL